MPSDSPIRTPWNERLRDFRKGPLTAVVWILALAVALGLLAGRSADYEYVGLARGADYELSSTQDGVVTSVLVQPYEVVAEGQVVARLSDARLLAQLQTAGAELARLRSSLEATAAENTVHSADITGELRRFQVDEQQLTLELLKLRVEQESNLIEHQRLAVNVEREEKLYREGLVAQATVEDSRLQRDAMAKRIEESRVLIGRTQDEARLLADRRDVFETRFSASNETDPVLKPLQDAIEVQALRIQELEIERQSLVLRSPVAGSVKQVLASTGQAVLSGEALLTVSEQSSSEIVVYLHEDDLREVKTGDRVLVANGSRHRTVGGAVIDRIGPVVEELPRRLWRDPAVPEFGIPLIVGDVSNMGLKAGQRVSVRTIAGDR